MSTCQGTGECITQCICVCENECLCGHGSCPPLDGGDYCKGYYCPHSCQLVECYNYAQCKQKRPKYILDCYMGMCIDCVLHLGKVTLLHVNGLCPICFETKELLGIQCGKHTSCLDCWKWWAEIFSPLSCPMCRQTIQTESLNS